MVILEAPYVSDHILCYLEQTQTPVLENDFALGYKEKYGLNLVNKEEMIQLYDERKQLYSISENALDWVYKNLSAYDIVDKINILKNKAGFRKLIESFYPDLFFAEVDLQDLNAFDIHTVKLPIVLKPSVGFFSLGVYVIFNKQDWKKALQEINKSQKAWKSQFPGSVVNENKFLLEQYIKGIEYAIDAYYDEEGNPIILNIFTHRFISDDDVSDRIYYTSKDIIEQFKLPFEQFLAKMNEKLQISDFPMHIEVRIEGDEIIPIEFNPLRFAGLCCTDIAYYAYGINTVEYYLNKRVPDFDKILADKGGKIYSLIILDKTKNMLLDKGFDYDKLRGDFENVLALRKVDTPALNIWGFLFTETRQAHTKELDDILRSDLSEYLL